MEVRLAISIIIWKKNRKEEKAHSDCCPVCNFRSDLLVWNQPGDQYSVASSFENAFHIPPLYTTIVLVAVAAVIVFVKRDGKVLDMIVPIMAVCYFFITIFIILINIKSQVF